MFHFHCPCAYLTALVHAWFTPPVTDEKELRWAQHAEVLERAHFIQWLADDLATDLLRHNPRCISIPMMIANVDDDSIGVRQHEAERFLDSQYVRCYDPTRGRRLSVFRHLIQRRLKSADKFRTVH